MISQHIAQCKFNSGYVGVSTADSRPVIRSNLTQIDMGNSAHREIRDKFFGKRHM